MITEYDLDLVGIPAITRIHWIVSDKIGYNLACVGDFVRFLRLYGGFRGWAIECRQLHYSPTDPRCHGNEIWDKIGYNLACVRDFWEICASIGGFSRMHHRMLLIAFSPTDPRCHGNEILDKKAVTRTVYEISARFLRL